ncbi:Growth-regulating factor 5 [Bienertia sinuspersici]
MMIGGRNNRSCAYAFTASQWQELEQQLLTFKYLMSGIPVPPELISTVIRNPLSSSSSRLFPHHQTLPIGWGCFQMGYGRKIDPEPGRCRRTDGKKWRCTKEACPDSKYCERHMHRGKNKTKKPFQVVPTTITPNSTTATTTIDSNLSTPTINLKPNCVASSPAISPSQTYPQFKTQKLQSTSFYPFLAPINDQSSSFSPNFTGSTQHNDTAPNWLYLNEMKGAVSDRILLGPLQDIGYNVNKEVKEERFGFDNKDDETQKQLFHHFLGD